MPKKGGKMRKVMGEYKRRTLRSGTGKPGQKRKNPVQDRRQAIAIGLSEARKAGERTGAKIAGKGSSRSSKSRERRLAGQPI